MAIYKQVRIFQVQEYSLRRAGFPLGFQFVLSDIVHSPALNPLSLRTKSIWTRCLELVVGYTRHLQSRVTRKQ